MAIVGEARRFIIRFATRVSNSSLAWCPATSFLRRAVVVKTQLEPLYGVAAVHAIPEHETCLIWYVIVRSAVACSVQFPPNATLSLISGHMCSIQGVRGVWRRKATRSISRFEIKNASVRRPATIVGSRRPSRLRRLRSMSINRA